MGDFVPMWPMPAFCLESFLQQQRRILSELFSTISRETETSLRCCPDASLVFWVFVCSFSFEVISCLDFDLGDCCSLSPLYSFDILSASHHFHTALSRFTGRHFLFHFLCLRTFTCTCCCGAGIVNMAVAGLDVTAVLVLTL